MVYNYCSTFNLFYHNSYILISKYPKFEIISPFFYYFDSSFLLLVPEFFLILAIFLYLCIIKNFNSFYISSLFFYVVLFIELFFFAYLSAAILYRVSYVQAFFFYSCFYCDTYALICKFFIVFFLILISIFVESKFI